MARPGIRGTERMPLPQVRSEPPALGGARGTCLSAQKPESQGPWWGGDLGHGSPRLVVDVLFSSVGGSPRRKRLETETQPQCHPFSGSCDPGAQ